MKIGIDARFWNETGVGRYIRNLVEELQKIDKKHEYVLFIQPQDKKTIERKLKNKHWRVVITPIHWHSLREQLEFPTLLYKENLDLMHFPYFSVPVRYKKPYIVTIHDLILHHFSTGEATTLPLPLYKIKLQAYKFIIQRAAQNARKIIAVSQSTKKELMDHLQVSSEKINVTYEGVDIQKGSVSKENLYGKYFLHVGNVYPHKNCQLLIDAFVKANMQDVQLLFVGKKDYFMQRLERKVEEAHSSDRVKFLGFVDDASLAALYRNALATVVPSLMEGFGLPVLEAMGNQCVVIASDIPSLREVAGKYAYYFDPMDTDELSQVLVNVAKKKMEEYDALKKGGEKRAREFSWKTMAEQTLAIYERSISI